MMAFQFAGRWGPEIFMDASQNLMRAKPITVYNKGTLVLATLYTDRTKGATAANPFITDAFGNGTFFADPGEYDIEYGEQHYTISVPMDSVEAQGDGPPTGPAGGDLAGFYPDPTFSAARIAEIAGKVAAAGHTNNSIPVSLAGTLADLPIGAGTILARLAAGNIVAATPTEIKTLLAIGQGDVAGLTAALGTLTADVAARITAATIDANSVLIGITDNTPIALAMPASTILARLAAGNIVAATPAQIRTLLGVQTVAERTFGPILLAAGSGTVIINHNLNTLDIVSVSIRKVSTGEFWGAKVTATDANNISIDFGTYVRTLNEFSVVIRT